METIILSVWLGLMLSLVAFAISFIQQYSTRKRHPRQKPCVVQQHKVHAQVSRDAVQPPSTNKRRLCRKLRMVQRHKVHTQVSRDAVQFFTRKRHPRQKPCVVQQHKVHTQVSRSAYRSTRFWQQLLTLVQFDIATAERLVTHQQRKHPGRTDRWYIEKAIWDLTRDRH